MVTSSSILICISCRSALRHLKTERVKLFDYCMPYYMPLNPPEDEDDKVVDILYPLEQPIVCEFNWEVDDYEDFADEKVKEEDLPENEKEKFMEFLKEKVRKRKRELKQAKDARKKAIDDMDAKAKEAFENIQFYKFYPAKTQDTPDVSNVKAKYIHRYYRNAHHLMQFASNVAFSISIAKELSYASWKSWHRNFEQLWEVLQGVGVRLFGEEGCGG
uniref:Uncharacterized protein n=1 Tax=Oryza brachyantha TaxID=4533 RepID=J3LD99_ORYBR